MTTFKDKIYSAGLPVFSIVFTAVLLLLSTYTVFNSGISEKTVLGHILSGDCKEMVHSSSLWAFPFAVTSPSLGEHFCLFLPLLCSAPFIFKFSAEMRGCYRFAMLREKSERNYFHKLFFKAGFGGAGCVTAGYLIFSAAVYTAFPKSKDFSPEPFDQTIEALNTVRLRLNDPINRFFGAQNELLSCLGTALSVFAFSFLVSVLCFMLYLAFKNKYKAIGFMLIVIFLSEQVAKSTAFKSANSRKMLALSASYLIFDTEGVMKRFDLNWLCYFGVLFMISFSVYLAAKYLFGKRVSN